MLPWFYRTMSYTTSVYVCEVARFAPIKSRGFVVTQPLVFSSARGYCGSADQVQHVCERHG